MITETWREGSFIDLTVWAVGTKIMAARRRALAFIGTLRPENPYVYCFKIRLVSSGERIRRFVVMRDEVEFVSPPFGV